MGMEKATPSGWQETERLVATYANEGPPRRLPLLISLCREVVWIVRTVCWSQS